MPPAPHSYDTIARRWLDLAQRRLTYYEDLYRSGRWRHYYTEEALAERMRDVIKAVRLWTKLVSSRRDDSDDLRPAA
jgi:uncharacterized repeat protein (TIGR03809 family)